MTVFCECLSILFNVAQPQYNYSLLSAARQQFRQRHLCSRELCTTAHVLRKVVCLQKGKDQSQLWLYFIGFWGRWERGGRIFSLCVPYMLMATVSYCCCRYIFKHLPVVCLYSSGALLCKVNDYQVSFLKVFLMALYFMMNTDNYQAVVGCFRF